jgi:hypothetical protein
LARTYVPRPTEGPSVGAYANRDGSVTVREVGPGEGTRLPGATVRASDDSRKAVARAAELVSDRVRRHATRPVVVTITVG